MFHKHALWEYEDEYRIINSNPKQLHVPFKPNSLKAVYIGPASLTGGIYNEVEKLIRGYNKQHSVSVQFFRIKRDPFTYVLSDDRIF